MLSSVCWRKSVVSGNRSRGGRPPLPPGRSLPLACSRLRGRRLRARGGAKEIGSNEKPRAEEQAASGRARCCPRTPRPSSQTRGEQLGRRHWSSSHFEGSCSLEDKAVPAGGRAQGSEVDDAPRNLCLGIGFGAPAQIHEPSKCLDFSWPLLRLPALAGASFPSGPLCAAGAWQFGQQSRWKVGFRSSRRLGRCRGAPHHRRLALSVTRS